MGARVEDLGGTVMNECRKIINNLIPLNLLSGVSGEQYKLDLMFH